MGRSAGFAPFALGRRAGARVWRLGSEPDAPWLASTGPGQAHLDGFDLHADLEGPAAGCLWDRGATGLSGEHVIPLEPALPHRAGRSRTRPGSPPPPTRRCRASWRGAARARPTARSRGARARRRQELAKLLLHELPKERYEQEGLSLENIEVEELRAVDHADDDHAGPHDPEDGAVGRVDEMPVLDLQL